MKRILMVLVIIFGFASLACGEAPVRKVQVVNDPLNVDVQNQPLEVNVSYESQPLAIEVVSQAEPLEVIVVDQPSPTTYKYIVIERNAASAFEDAVNTKAALGGELKFFLFRPEGGIYLGVVRMPLPEE